MHGSNAAREGLFSLSFLPSLFFPQSSHTRLIKERLDGGATRLTLINARAPSRAT